MSTWTVPQAWLFHGLHPVHILIYLDCFTVPTVSQSQHFGRILIWAADGILAFNVALVLIPMDQTLFDNSDRAGTDAKRPGQFAWMTYSYCLFMCVTHHRSTVHVLNIAIRKISMPHYCEVTWASRRLKYYWQSWTVCQKACSSQQRRKHQSSTSLVLCEGNTPEIGLFPITKGHMMTSSNGNIFGVTGHLCGEFTSHRWFPRTKTSDMELWCFLWFAPEWTVE